MIEPGFLFVILFHVIFAVVWIGGMTTLLLVLIPAAKNSLSDKKLINKLMLTTQKKLNTYAYTSMIILFATGLLLAIKEKALITMFTFATPHLALLGAKSILFLVMILIGLSRTFWVPSLKLSNEEKEKIKVKLLITNVIIGWIIIILSVLLPII